MILKPAFAVTRGYLEMTPLDRLHTTSYSHSIVTLVLLACTVSERQHDMAANSQLQLCISIVRFT